MLTLKEIAEHVGGEVQGDANWQIENVGTLRDAQQQQISFLSNSRYKKYLNTTQAGAVIVSPDMADDVPSNAVVVADPYVAYAKVVALLNPEPDCVASISPSAVISEWAVLPDNIQIGHHVVIEDNVTLGDYAIIGSGTVIGKGSSIGAHARISANVTIYPGVTIGERSRIHSGVVIGSDGFGIANDKGRWVKIPQIGGVTIGNDVEIGANTTIDRGALEDTTIGNGVKLDNQIQIGHNVTIGDNSAIAGCVGIAGSTHVGKQCIIGGGVGVSGHLEITDNVMITGMTMVTKSLTKPGTYSSGMPVEPSQQWHKNVVRYRQLDKLSKRVKQLETHNEK